MIYVWFIPVLLLILLLVILFPRRVHRTGGNYDDARRRADVIRHGDEDQT